MFSRIVQVESLIPTPSHSVTVSMQVPLVPWALPSWICILGLTPVTRWCSKIFYPTPRKQPSIKATFRRADLKTSSRTQALNFSCWALALRWGSNQVSPLRRLRNWIAILRPGDVKRRKTLHTEISSHWIHSALDSITLTFDLRPLTDSYWSVTDSLVRLSTFCFHPWISVQGLFSLQTLIQVDLFRHLPWGPGDSLRGTVHSETSEWRSSRCVSFWYCMFFFVLPPLRFLTIRVLLVCFLFLFSFFLAGIKGWWFWDSKRFLYKIWRYQNSQFWIFWPRLKTHDAS